MKSVVRVGDALDMLTDLDPGEADLIIADPPYGIKKDKDFGAFREFDEWLNWCGTWLRFCRRALAPDGNLFVYGIHANACFLQVEMLRLGLVYRRQIIWHYENGFSKYRNAPACHYEPLLWFAKSPTSTYHTIREPYPSASRLLTPVFKKGKAWRPHPDGRQGGDVWKFPVLAGKRFAKERVNHPTQKPLAIAERIVKHFSSPGELVVVPFVGSGTECVAAKKLGRKFIGVDTNPAYVEIANRRLWETR